MKETTTTKTVLSFERPGKIYSNSILRVARHFWNVRQNALVLNLADELLRHPEIPVVGVIDEERKVVGIVRRDRFFAQVSKPFGREVLRRSTVAEVTDTCESIDANSDIFAVAQRVLKNTNDDDSAYYPLHDETGKCMGLFSVQDISNYLSKITRDDIELAGRLQERLLASNELSEGDGWRIDAWSRAAKGVGGDFYFSSEFEDGKIFTALCDVSGKGVAASLIVSMVWGMLRMYDFRGGLSDLIVQLNRSIITTFHMEKYLTGFFMIYDPLTMRIDCADMGHSHIVLIREGKVHHIRGKTLNLPIGVETVITPAVDTFRLRKGDALLVHSDGITEQENANGEEFGEPRLSRTVIHALTSNTPLQEEVPVAVDAFRGSAPQQDDMSCVLLDLGVKVPE
ncbi:MAG: SpoIIE family protein phosphatase [Treponemataceae bacterium]